MKIRISIHDRSGAGKLAGGRGNQNMKHKFCFDPKLLSISASIRNAQSEYGLAYSTVASPDEAEGH